MPNRRNIGTTRRQPRSEAEMERKQVLHFVGRQNVAVKPFLRRALSETLVVWIRRQFPDLFWNSCHVYVLIHIH